VTDALARRDWFVEATARRLRATGVAVPTEAIQKIAAADLQHLDAVRAAGDLRSKSTPKPAPTEPRESRKAAAQAAKIGAEVRVRHLPAADPVKVQAPLRGILAQKTYAMAARLRLIGQRNGHRVMRGEDMEHGFEIGALARAAAEETFNHNAQRGIYAGHNATDRDRILFRRMEDICDRSNAFFPPWWVK